MNFNHFGINTPDKSHSIVKTRHNDHRFGLNVPKTGANKVTEARSTVVVSQFIIQALPTPAIINIGKPVRSQDSFCRSTSESRGTTGYNWFTFIF